MSTSEPLDAVLERLKAQGRTVQMNPGVSVDEKGIQHIMIDGQPRSIPEIYRMLVKPDGVFGFKAGGKEVEVHIYYVAGDVPTYEIHQDGTRQGDRQRLPDGESVPSWVHRLANTMGATTLPERL